MKCTLMRRHSLPLTTTAEMSTPKRRPSAWRPFLPPSVTLMPESLLPLGSDIIIPVLTFHRPLPGFVFVFVLMTDRSSSAQCSGKQTENIWMKWVCLLLVSAVSSTGCNRETLVLWGIKGSHYRDNFHSKPQSRYHCCCHQTALTD